MNGKVSVLMGVYNCAHTLQYAIESIQNQTYENWEIILCDDGSSDDTYQVAKEIASKDSRIILLKNKKNQGLNTTLNKCFAHATGEYIARMDGDDESMPTRFEKQVQFLESQDEYFITSTPMVFFDEKGDWGQSNVIEKPSKKDVVCGSPICHAPVMMRRECMEKVGGYTEDLRMLRVEDVNLWIKLYAAGYRCYNLKEPLYRMRNDKNAFNRRKYKYRVNSTYTRLKGCKLLGMGIDCYIKSFFPMVIGLVPMRLRKVLRKIKAK